MRITKIAVKDLFGVFNHDIPLNTTEHITIIHGPNGYGKTILLTLVNELFNSKYNKILTIPFKELSISFDNDSMLILKKNGKSEENGKKKASNENSLILELFEKGAKAKSHKIEFAVPSDLSLPSGPLQSFDPAMGRIGLNYVHQDTFGKKKSSKKVVSGFEDTLSVPFIFKGKSEPVWLKEIINTVPIHFIETQRLFDFSFNPGKPNENATSNFHGKVEAVTNYSKELAELIQANLAEYGTLSQSLDRTFPTRLVKNTPSTLLSLEQLRDELNQLEEKRKRLTTTGFMDKEQEIDFKDLQNIDKNNAHVLAVYIADGKQKLSVFDELMTKIDLLIKIINSRFLYKQLSISKTDGFVFTTSDGKRISPNSLSSGEQHELVLLYGLLFKVSPESLILIDEPELSLHIYWQQQFLKDLGEITKLIGFDVLIATHSPQIINDRWDLTVELKGPNQ